MRFLRVYAVCHGNYGMYVEVCHTVLYFSLQADFVVLTTSEDSGLCYIETAELDG